MTLDSYKLQVSKFIEVVGFPGNMAALWEWLEHWENARTRHDAWGAVRTFIRWAAAHGLCADWTAGIRVKRPAAPHEPTLTVEEFERIVAAITTRTAKGKRDRALYACLFYTGCRRDAVRLLKRADVNLSDRYIRVRTKGAREAVLPLPRRPALLLHDWMMVNPDPVWAFPSTRRNGRPIDAHQVSRNIHGYARAAGFTRRVHVHLLRHSAATIMAQAGVQIDVIQAVLLHSDIRVTQGYINDLMATERRREALDRVFG